MTEEELDRAKQGIALRKEIKELQERIELLDKLCCTYQKNKKKYGANPRLLSQSSQSYVIEKILSILDEKHILEIVKSQKEVYESDLKKLETKFKGL